MARTTRPWKSAALHDPDAERLITHDDNATLYEYGFLTRADELCFWHKERGEAAKLLEGVGDIPPGCAL